MLDKVTPEMKKLGEGALPYDGGLYPVRPGFDRNCPEYCRSIYCLVVRCCVFHLITNELLK
jgi:hypothetical protein